MRSPELVKKQIEFEVEEESLAVGTAHGNLLKELGNLHEGAIIECLNNQVYHSGPGISSTQLRRFYSDPYGYWFDIVHRDSRPEKESFKMGRMIHGAILENKKILSDEYMAVAYGNRRSDKYQKWKTGKEREGHYVLTGEECLMIKQFILGVRCNRMIRGLFDGNKSLKECSIYVQCPRTDLILRIRPDILDLKSFLIGDLKTSAIEINQSSWSRVLEKYRYDIQAAYYLYVAEIFFGHRPHAFPFIVLEKTRPYKVRLAVASPSQIEVAREIVIRTLANMRERFDSLKGSRLHSDGWGTPIDKEVYESVPSLSYEGQYGDI